MNRDFRTPELFAKSKMGDSHHTVRKLANFVQKFE